MKYGKNIIFSPDKLDSLSIDRQSIGQIQRNLRVLEIGCSTGFAGEYLIANKNCIVVGVEIAEDEAKVAKRKLTYVIKGDIEDKGTIDNINNLEKFDIVYASALIEHLKYPKQALVTWNKFLKKKGKIVVSTSNISHWSTRFQMMLGNFEYSEYGILDNTHLRFYNTKTFKKLVEEAGYKILSLSIDPVGGGFPKISKFMSNFFPNLFAYQILIVASKK